MIKKITILLFFAIAILPATFNKAQAQNYATEGMPQEDGSIDYYHRVDFTYGPSEWVYDYTVVPSDVDWCECSGTPNPDDPTNQPDWGFPDWAEMEDYLNYLDEMIGEPYSYENTWGGTYDSTGVRYYITVDSKPEKHYDGSRIGAAKRSGGKIKLILGKEGGSALEEPGLRWKVNGVLKSSNRKEILFPVDVKGDFNIEVWEETIRKHIQFTVSVFGGPAVFFHKWDNYIGEYGFDEEGHKYDSLKKDYQKILVDSLNYDVPWMSLLDGQTATVRVSPVISATAASDTATWVEFRPSLSSKIQINGSITPFRQRGSELSGLQTINIKGFELDSTIRNYKQDSIVVVSNTGDTIGKLMISCQKPDKRKVVLVYVNTGRGFRNYSKEAFRDSVNIRSHNQIFRQWELVNPDTLHLYDASGVISSRVVTGMDTLDARSEFLADSSKFLDAARFLDYIDTLFLNHKGVDMIYDVQGTRARALVPDSLNKIHFSFIMNYPLGASGSSTTTAITLTAGYKNIFWSSVGWQTVGHEMGHFIKLQHTFPEWKDDSNTIWLLRYDIPIHTTTNFMDYYYSGYDNSDMFFFRQWKNAF